MPDSIDVYSDQFQVTTGPYGGALAFAVSPATPPAVGSAPLIERVATVRMSLEHLKVMTFVLRRQIIEHERKSGITIPIPIPILNDIGISPEDWDSFWKAD